MPPPPPSSSSPSPSPSPLKTTFTQDGFVIIPNLIEASPSEFTALESAARRTIAKARSGAWPHRRVVGRQFPPFDVDVDADSDSWGVQHVMHPDLGEPAFVEWYTGDRVVRAVRELLGCEEGELQMELFNLLINPESHAFALRWHRDDVREDASKEEEVRALALWHHGVQWNTALYDDASLFVVPGSHALPRTPAQRARSETLEPPTNPLDMPGAVQVLLKAGETVFYNSNILHCARYSADTPRATLHACMGDSTRGGVARARNVLQHGLRWMGEARFREGLPEGGRARAMLGRLLRMEKDVEAKGGEVGVGVGYSLEN